MAAGRTSPNPLVGSVVVDDDGTVIAEGFHTKAGQPHAEVEALNRAGEAARGKTLYVNLEPCCHWGKTPPCSERVIASGVKRVVCGTLDPNPKVAGGGLKAIEAAGIETRSGVLAKQCEYVNRAFIQWINTKRPWIALKMACTLDGRIADRNGKSRWITGAESRKYVHQLRNEFDAVMIGAATALADDPELTVREIENSRDPLRVIVDATLALNVESRLAQNPDRNTLIAALASAIEEKSGGFADTVNFLEAPARESPDRNVNDRQQIDLNGLMQQLGELNVLSVLCEGGSRLAAALLEEQLVDEAYWFMAPKFLRDAQSTPVLAGVNPTTLDAASILIDTTIQQLGEDVLIHGLVTSS